MEHEKQQEFDALEDLYIDSIPHFRLLDAILFDRDIVIIGTLPPPNGLAHRDHLLSLQDLYNRMTGFVAIKEWDSAVRNILFDCLITDTSSFQDYSLSNLCSPPVKSFSDTLKEQNQKALSEQVLPQLLDEKMIQTIEDNIDLLLLPAYYTSHLLYGDINNSGLYRHIWEYFQSSFLRRDDSIDNRIDVW